MCRLSRESCHCCLVQGRRPISLCQLFRVETRYHLPLMTILTAQAVRGLFGGEDRTAHNRKHSSQDCELSLHYMHEHSPIMLTLLLWDRLWRWFLNIVSYWTHHHNGSASEVCRQAYNNNNNNNNLYSPWRKKQYTKYKRLKNYKTKPKTEDRQINMIYIMLLVANTILCSGFVCTGLVGVYKACGTRHCVAWWKG